MISPCIEENMLEIFVQKYSDKIFEFKVYSHFKMQIYTFIFRNSNFKIFFSLSIINLHKKYSKHILVYKYVGIRSLL